MRQARYAPEYDTSQELAPSDCPCVLLVRQNDGVHALTAGADRMRLLPARGQDGGSAREVLAEDGHVVFLEAMAWRDDPTLEYLDRRYSTGIFRLDLRNMATTRLPFEPRPGRMTRRWLGASRDGERLLIAESWSLPIEIPRDATPAEQSVLRYNAGRTTLTLVDVAREESHELDTFAGGIFSAADDLPIQWSPDGTRVAVGTWGSLVPGKRVLPQIRLLDVVSGVLIGSVPDAQLIGSLSWSPDSSRFLIARSDQVLAHDVATLADLLLPGFPDQRVEPPGHGAHRVLGFADDGRILSATERGKSMTVWLTDHGTGEVEQLCRCAGRSYQYPVVAPVPVSRWR